MSAPLGNTFGAKKNRILGDILKRELHQNPNDVLAIVRKTIECAKAGEEWAQRLVYERADGKLPQPIVGDDDEPPLQFSQVRRTIIDTAKPADNADAQPTDR